MEHMFQRIPPEKLRWCIDTLSPPVWVKSSWEGDINSLAFLACCKPASGDHRKL